MVSTSVLGPSVEVEKLFPASVIPPARSSSAKAAIYSSSDILSGSSSAGGLAANIAARASTVMTERVVLVAEVVRPLLVSLIWAEVVVVVTRDVFEVPCAATTSLGTSPRASSWAFLLKYVNDMMVYSMTPDAHINDVR